MNGFLQKLISPRLRKVSAAFCLLALSMQVTTPALHRGHEAGFVAADGSGAVELRSAADHASSHSDHDPATCPQCRLVSQFRTLLPLSVLSTLPVLAAAWIASPAQVVAAAQQSCDIGAPRAPPLLA